MPSGHATPTFLPSAPERLGRRAAWCAARPASTVRSLKIVCASDAANPAETDEAMLVGAAGAAAVVVGYCTLIRVTAVVRPRTAGVDNTVVTSPSFGARRVKLYDLISPGAPGVLVTRRSSVGGPAI
jgi:hypothetical protein